MAVATVLEQSLRLNAERLCLDFANTVNWHASEHPIEELNTYAELLNWSRRAGLMSDADVPRLRRLGLRAPAAAGAVLERAHNVREAIYHVLSAHAKGRPPAQADLGTLNAAVADMLVNARLVPGSEAFVWGWVKKPEALDVMLWPIVRSAVDLLTSPEVGRVGQCADDRGCGWLFLDQTKNHSRRWCDMKDCGNRAKARRHYERKKAAA